MFHPPRNNIEQQAANLTLQQQIAATAASVGALQIAQQSGQQGLFFVIGNQMPVHPAQQAAPGPSALGG